MDRACDLWRRRRRGKSTCGDQCLLELEQCRRAEQCSDFLDAVPTQEEGGEAEQEPIERSEIRRALPGSIADQELLFEQQGFCDDGADPTGTAQLRDGDQQIDAEDVEFAHAANRTMIATVRKARTGGSESLILRIRHRHAERAELHKSMFTVSGRYRI